MKPMSKERAGLDQVRPGEYRVNEVFYTLQGEGVMAGTPMVFVRLSHCNLRCAASNEAGFDCDTDFEGGRWMTAEQIHEAAVEAIGDDVPGHKEVTWVLLTGGEPGLQLDKHLVKVLTSHGWSLAVETNGTIKLPEGLDWICVSPKTAEHTIRQRRCNELKVVRHHGQALAEFATMAADNCLISVAFQPDGSMRAKDVAWCVQLVKENPHWRLSLQTHKFLGVR